MPTVRRSRESEPLVAIGHVDVLPTLFREVFIPPEVASELASPRRPPEVRAFNAPPPPWLHILAPSSVKTIPGLDAGETAAIALAEEVQAGRLIIDEYRVARPPRNAACVSWEL